MESQTKSDSLSSSPSPATVQLLTLLEDYHSFNPSRPPLLPWPTSLQFSKQVSKGLPCVYTSSVRTAASNTNGTAGFHDLTEPAATVAHLFQTALTWTRESLVQRVTEKVEVALTPDGRADSLCLTAGEKVFLQPASLDMTIEELLEKLCPPDQIVLPYQAVYYLQSQNSNLTTTPLAPLLRDLPSDLPFTEGVLGAPEAVNIWIGNSQSVTSVHRDPYENVYVVLKGMKIFTLWAPVEELTLSAQMVRTGRYVYDSATIPPSFSIALDDVTDIIPWVPIDPDLPHSTLNEDYPLYAHAKPQRVTVHEGQALYLPAGWYHHVAQQCGRWPDGTEAPCIAVNYWYDQDYEGEKFVTRQLISRLIEQSRKEQSG